MGNYKVFIGRAPQGYDSPEELSTVIRRGLSFFETAGKLQGRIALKPNIVLAHKRMARECFTRPEIVESLLNIIAPSANQITILENSGRGAPTAAQMRHTRFVNPGRYPRGYFTFEKMFPGKVRCRPIMEDQLVHFILNGEADGNLPYNLPGNGFPAGKFRFWNRIETSISFAQADYVIYMPKLKTNVLSHGMTGALKLGGIGNLTDRNRMTGHNFLNDVRIADMLDAVKPHLIITDAIRAAIGGNQMTQRGKDLGAILIADNPVAHDTVVAHLLHLNPREVEHLNLACERGHGPVELGDIEIIGDFPLKEAQEISRSWNPGFIPVTEFGKKVKDETGMNLPVEIISGGKYDVPGSQGVLLDWLYMVYDDPEHRQQIARWPACSILVGGFEKLPSHSKVYLIGDPAWRKWQTHLEKSVGITIPDSLQNFIGLPKRVDRYRLKNGRKGWAVYIKGDPPSHKDMIGSFVFLSGFKMRASLFQFQIIFDAYILSFKEKFIGWWRNRRGIPEIPVDTGSEINMEKIESTLK